MKKSLVALAVLAASGASFAQSSVTLYGLADIWFGSVKADDGVGNSVTQTKLDSGGVNTSRWGVKGSEDLGGGLKAIFKLEQGFALDTGAAKSTSDIFGNSQGNQAFSREAYVGFSGGFGDVKLGKVWTAYDDVSGASNAVFDSALAPMNNVFRSTGYLGNPGNTIYYSTPSFSGFAGAISYSMGEDAVYQTPVPNVTVKDTNILSLNMTYSAGPLALQLGYQAQEATTSFGNTVIGDDTAEFWRVGGSYDFGMATVKGTYGSVANLGNVTGVDADEYQIGADFPVGPAWVISASYAASQGKGILAEDAQGWGIAATYTLSKRTFLYGGYNYNTYEVDSQPDATGEILAVGVQHRF
ncbi:porin [Rhodoferax sp.]|uniref:porin n=1 Tax=Rhodoferax sp. TaxID=50421 RepID=UPI0026002DAA|nr:porin [Rhodoferax sp.]